MINKKSLVILSFAILFSSLGVKYYYAVGNTAQVTGTVLVNTACVFSTNSAAINFGALNPGTNTVGTPNTILVTNIGNTNSNILVSGSNWNNGGQNFNVANTVYNSVTTTTFPSIRLSGSSTDTLIPVNTVSGNTIFFGLGIPAAQASGTYSQTINVISSC